MFNYLLFGKMTCFLNICVMTCKLETMHITDMSYANNLAQRMHKVKDLLFMGVKLGISDLGKNIC